MRVNGLVLETPFTSTRAMLKALYPQKWLPYQYLWPFLRSHLNSWANFEAIALKYGTEAPAIHIIEAGKDELVPSNHGEELYQRCVELGLPVDLRDYGIGAQILVDLGLSSIRLLTNNPKKIVGLEGYGLSVTDQIPIEHAPGAYNRDYLKAKKERLGHLLHHQGLALDEEMIHEERLSDRARAEAEADLYGHGPAPRRTGE
jgi:hypothetical protein